MPAAPFARVLDRMIDDRAGSSSTAATAGIHTAPLLSAPFAATWQARDVAMRRFGVGQPRTRRVLTGAQQRALDLLRRAGARIGDDFAHAELKASFRQLARELHPDRHPAATDDERARLCARFHEVRRAYGVLQGRSGA